MENFITTKDFINLKPIEDIFNNKQKEEDGFVCENENYHALFRKTFNLKKDETSAYKINITADDSYKLYINGTFISQGPAPCYVHLQNYNTFDITNYLNDGENIIAIHTYYHGRTNYAIFSGDLRFGLWLEVKENEDVILKTDESFKYYIDKSYVSGDYCWGYDTQFCENIDRNLHPIGWTNLSFDDSNWENAIINKNDDHILRKQMTKTVCTYEVFPKEITKLDNGNFLLDFGSEIAANIKVKTKAKKGDKVTIMFGEELLDNGHVRYDMRCDIIGKEVWTFKDGEDEFESFDYTGFRYLELEIDSDSITPSDFSALVRHYPVDKIKDCPIDDTLLKDIWEICKNAVIYGTQEAHFDCITREKGAYLGDMLVTGMSFYHLTGITDIMKKSLYDFKASQFISDAMMCLSCASKKHTIADYSFIFPELLYNYYKITKDKDTVKDLIDACDKIINYYKKYQRQDGLLDAVSEWNLVDWPANLRDSYDFDLEKPTKKGAHNVVNAFYYGAMKYTNMLYKILGKDEKYNLDEFKSVFMKTFYNEKTHLFTDSEISCHSALHSNVIPLYYDMTQDNKDKIIDLIMEKEFSCGVYFTYFVLKALCENNEKEKAMHLIKSKGEHSWYNMLSEGATTVFEAWGKDQKWNTSLCHPWASSPIIILSEYFN